MNAFKKATKRITAVAASAAMVSSAVFGAGLSNYPTNFEDSGVTVVYGSAASAADMTSAQSIIDALTSEGTTSYKVTATMSSSGAGESISAVKSNKQLNYGESLGTETETAGFDDQDIDVLADGRFDNDISDEDYTQKLTLKNGAFNYALRDEVEGVDEITDGIFYNNGDDFAEYVLEFDNSISLADADFDEDLIGKELVIMGNEFTISEATKSGSNLDKLVLLGGSNKVALGEGEEQTVTVEGKSYEVSVQSVSDTKVLLTINGESTSIDEFDTDEVGGVNVAVTDLVSSSRDAVKGYAELVIGGQKVTLEAGAIQINDEDLDDIYDEYDVDVAFSGTGMETITITYSVDDDTLLQKGDMLTDVLFDTFSLVYEGTNEPEYTDFKITTTKEEVQFSGTLENGESIPSEFKLYYTTEGASGGDLILGDEDYRIFFDSTNFVAHSADGVTYVANGTLSIDTSNIDIKDYGFFYAQDLDDQFLYTISSVDDDNLEVDFDELIEGKSNAEVDVKSNEWDSELEDGADYEINNVSGVVRLDVDDMHTPILSLEGYLLMNFADAEDDALTSTADASLVVYLDNTESGVDGDDTDEEDDQFTIDISFPSDVDDSLNVQINEGGSDEANSGSLADAVDGDDDVRVYVTQYGLMATVDNDEYDSITISVPEEQVYAKVNLVFGEGSSSESMTEMFASEDEADARAEELEDEGYTVKVEEVTSEAVDFEVSAVTLDSDVTGTEDLIVVGGPAVNTVAADLLGLSFPSYGAASGLTAGEAVIRYFEDENSVLVYGWEAEDTQAAAAKLNAGGLSGNEVNA